MIDAFFAELRDEQRALRQLVEKIDERLARIERVLPKRLATVEEAAEELGHCRATIQRMARSGRLPAVRRGRKWLVDLSRVRPVETDDVAAAAAAARE